MDVLEERLKTIRLTHRLFMATCLALLVFSSSPEKNGSHEAALKELRDLRSVDLISFGKWATDYDYSTHKVHDLAKFAVENHILIQAKKLKNVEIVLSEKDNNYFHGAIDKERLDGLRRGGTVSDYRRFIEQNVGLDYAIPHGELLGLRFHEELNEKLATCGRTGDEKWRLKVNVNVVRRRYYPPESRHVMVDVSFNVIAGDTMTPEVLRDPNRAFGFEVESVEAITETFEARRFQIWLKSKGLFNKLVWSPDPHSGGVPSSPSTDQIVFPATLDVWDEVQDRSLDSAISWLEKKIHEKQSRPEAVEVLGVKIEGYRMMLFGPLLTLVLLLYLLAHMKNVGEAVRGSSESAERYSWMALYSNCVAVALTWMSLTVLPLATVGWLLWRTWEPSSVFFWVGFILSLLTVIVSIYVAYCAQRLRRSSEGRGGCQASPHAAQEGIGPPPLAQ